MRPHRLEVTAFGAFAGTVEICFRDLAAAGLFLLHGETGAGKTTLLDAIGFALYGRVPGVRAQARRLRSDHADEWIRTQVLLEVTISCRLLRITRSPEQTRRKRRGSRHHHRAGQGTARRTRRRVLAGAFQPGR